jgi:hypothetical protein
MVDSNTKAVAFSDRGGTIELIINGVSTTSRNYDLEIVPGAASDPLVAPGIYFGSRSVRSTLYSLEY